jgi:hypothetical protein
VKLLADNVVLTERAADSMWSVRQLAQAFSEQSEEAADLMERFPPSATPGEYEVCLTLSIVSQAILGLAEQLSELEERLSRLEARQK